jgi:hypothetical protein
MEAVMEERKKAESMSMEGLVEHACHFSANVFAGRRDKFEALVSLLRNHVLRLRFSAQNNLAAFDKFKLK